MEPAIPDLRDIDRADAYAQLLAMQTLLLDGADDPVSAMATISALLHHAFGHLWTGFYRVVTPGQLLRVGPYQGSLGCLDIAFGRGVCGTAAAERRTVIGADGALIAVLDIDSGVPNAFGEEDRVGLESMVAWFARTTYVPLPA
jgi:L-methionine (R)-S-oxide reductase